FLPSNDACPYERISGHSPFEKIIQVSLALDFLPLYDACPYNTLWDLLRLGFVSYSKRRWVNNGVKLSRQLVQS
ncbi:MAG: hypothetical protein JAY60_14040, partial [Candidatus Thiodiazotropha weberae]|nr:hypothetical protein [Candidatus Thiodiazotropha weberae]